MKILIKYSAYFLLVAGCFVLLWLWWFFYNHGLILTKDGFVPDMEVTGQIGDFIGGVFGTIFSMVSALLLVLTIMDQNKQHTKDVFLQSFYEMLHIHNDNVKGLTYTRRDKIYYGRAVFSQLLEDFNKTYELVESYINGIQNGSAFDIDGFDDMCNYLKNHRKKKILILRLSYGYFFFGSEQYRMKNKYMNAIADCVMKIMKQNGLYVEEHCVLLGHYYRHLFQMIKHITDSKVLTEEERYVYAKQIRAQLNDDEQLLLYYNAMSEVGHNWIETPVHKWYIYDKVKKMNLLARYRMIKNIPPTRTIKGVQPNNFFENEIAILKNKNIDFFEQER